MPTRRTLLISGASTIITALLSPRAMAAQRRLIEGARGRFDVILLDTAPILTTNDAAELLGVVDHVLLVVRAGSTKAEAFNGSAIGERLQSHSVQ